MATPANCEDGRADPRAFEAAVTFKISALIALSLAMLVALSIQIPLLSDSELGMTLRNATHALLFGLLAFGWLTLFQPAGAIAGSRLPASLLALLLLALSAELLEAIVYNGFSLVDLSGNLLGVLLGFAVWKLIVRPSDRQPRRGPYVLLAALILMATVVAPVSLSLNRVIQQARWFPVLLDGGMSSANPRITPLRSGPDIETTWLDDGLHLRLVGGGIPGIALTGFEPDWTGHDCLMLDVENPSSTRFRFEMHLRDQTGSAHWDDRFNFEQMLEPGERAQFQVPLTEIENAPKGRQLDTGRMAVIAIYSGAAHSDSIILHSITLK